MTLERQLILQELTLPASCEWVPPDRGWFIARIAEGDGYWLPRGKAVQELGPGQGIVAAHHGGGMLRASRLCPLKLQYFHLDTKSFNGLLTLAERERIENALNGSPPLATIFTAHDRIGLEFTRIAALSPGSGLSSRCQLLQLWAGAITGLIGEPAAETAQPAVLADRLRQLIGQMSETELAECELSDLAQQLNCSERHFGRLFGKVFGVPFHRRQIQLRLQRARQLLAESDAKIINIAYDCGYRHLGLFNTMFKRHFGVTPSEWRARTSRAAARNRPRALAVRAGLLLFLCLLLPRDSRAQTTAPPTAANPPAAAASTNQPPAKPAETAPARTFAVRRYEIIGNSILAPEEMQRIIGTVTNSTGPAVTVERIRSALAALQLAYRERGYVTVAVSLPQQQLTNGIVQVRVTEGLLAAINVIGNRYFSSNSVMRSLPSLQTNMLLNSKIFQTELDRANENRDRQIYPVVGPGPDPGTSALTLKIKDRLPLHAHVEINNQSPPGTPDLRAVVSAQYNNLWDLDHQVGFDYSFSPEKEKNQHIYSDGFADNPYIANLSTFYRVPLGNIQSVQEQIDNQPYNFGYNEITHQFVLPPGTGRPELNFYASRSTSDTGIQYAPATLESSSSSATIVSQQTGENYTLNENLGVRFSLPLPEFGRLKTTLIAGLDFKRYRITSFNTNNFYESTQIGNNQFGPVYFNTSVFNAAPPTYHAVDYLPLDAGFDSSLADNWGTTLFNFNAGFNVLPVLSGDAAFAGAAYSTNAAADYVVLGMGFRREQEIYKGWAVSVRANGQWASKPLLSNEQFGMGGSTGVRGYPEGEQYADSGWRATFEPKTPPLNLRLVNYGVPVPFWVRGSVFMDYGKLYAESAGGFNHNLSFWGAGFGMTAGIEDHLDARVTIAWPLTPVNNIPAYSPRIYFGLGVQF